VGSEGEDGLDSDKDPGQAAITTTSSGEPEGSGKALPTGARLAEFEIIRVLGEGGFGIVYLAFDQQLHRHVAIKEYFPSSYAVRRDAQTITALSPNQAETYRAGMASFIEEARLLARFEHPALVKVLRYWEANGTAYMVMPHYAGRTLRDLLKTPDEYSTEVELRWLMSPLLDAVAVMHDEHCFHRVFTWSFGRLLCAAAVVCARASVIVASAAVGIVSFMASSSCTRVVASPLVRSTTPGSARRRRPSAARACCRAPRRGRSRSACGRRAPSPRSLAARACCRAPRRARASAS